MSLCKKHSVPTQLNSIDNQGEGNIIIDTKQQKDGSNIDEGDYSMVLSKINNCDRCRTEWLTKTLTLRCYYCQSGFLRNLTMTNLNKFTCTTCGKTIESLSMIVQSVADSEEEFEFWFELFENQGNCQNHLEMMEKRYELLSKLISEDNIRMVRYGLKLSKTFQTKGLLEKSIRYCHKVVLTLLSYCFEVVFAFNDENSLDIEKEFWQIWSEVDSLGQEHRKQAIKFETNNEILQIYFNDLGKLETKFKQQQQLLDIDKTESNP